MLGAENAYSHIFGTSEILNLAFFSSSYRHLLLVFEEEHPYLVELTLLLPRSGRVDPALYGVRASSCNVGTKLWRVNLYLGHPKCVLEAGVLTRFL